MTLDKDFNNLIPDVYRLLDGKDLISALPDFSSKLASELGNKFLEYEEEREGILRMSNLGKPLRQLWYDLKGYKSEPLSSETKFKFLYGLIIEELFLFLAKQAGHEVTDEQKEIEVDGVLGHIDAKIDGVLVDIKSCSPYSYNKFLYGTLLTDDPFGYVSQLSGYKEAEKCERAAFIAIDKVHGKICSYEIPREYDYDVRSRITEVRKAVAGDSEPKRCYPDQPISKKDQTGNHILSVGCSYCGHKDHCWRDSNEGRGLQLRQYSTGPKWFTRLVREPRLKYNNQQEEAYESFPVKEE